ncbi:alkaline shock response membrane anchor protein AmaP [Cohnella thailandensis]|uniref:Alkaline shock response membrane anchor protein AmaP n=1 Tax=Cohnella thailandensis TaxID=557557 RepID=A0A841SZ71_9BACL|nr:alkaline shock response membrane anchor protein AmaP [Cohnella thailandensis]MBB6635525.1 alkaline shock response membrane anchor protein AmaP [Cohnella thailandensis]MBP1974905.1 putative alkaline shock family protein YloU [Cohnella thailandensis]
MIKVMDRLLLFVYSLAVGAASVFAIVMAAGGFDADWLKNAVDDIIGEDALVQTLVIAIGVVLLLLSLRIFIVSFKRSGGQAPSINQRTEHGDIRISVDTVENLALKAASRTRGVKDLKARVRAADSGLQIMIRAFVDGDTPIPALSEEMQKTVSELVQETTGIPVSEVSVYIANVTQAPTTYKSRVE